MVLFRNFKVVPIIDSNSSLKIPLIYDMFKRKQGEKKSSTVITMLTTQLPQSHNLVSLAFSPCYSPFSIPSVFQIFPSHVLHDPSYMKEHKQTKPHQTSWQFSTYI